MLSNCSRCTNTHTHTPCCIGLGTKRIVADSVSARTRPSRVQLLNETVRVQMPIVNNANEVTERLALFG
jgi:hypothetical protein